MLECNPGLPLLGIFNFEGDFVPFEKKTRNESSQVVNQRKKDHDYEFGLSNGFKHNKNYVLSHKGCLKNKLHT